MVLDFDTSGFNIFHLVSRHLLPAALDVVPEYHDQIAFLGYFERRLDGLGFSRDDLDKLIVDSIFH